MRILKWVLGKYLGCGCDVYELGSQHITHRHCQSHCVNEGEEDGGENKNEISTIVRRSVNILQKLPIIPNYFSKQMVAV